MGKRSNPEAFYWREMLRMEKEFLEYVVKEVAGKSHKKAVAILGIDRDYFYTRVKKTGANIGRRKVRERWAETPPKTPSTPEGSTP